MSESDSAPGVDQIDCIKFRAVIMSESQPIEKAIPPDPPSPNIIP